MSLVSLTNVKKRIVNILIVISLFEAYKVGDFYTYPITGLLLSLLLILVISLLNIKSLKINKTGEMSYIFIIYVIINLLVLQNFPNITSFALCLFYFIFIFFTYREITNHEFNKYVNIYKIFVTFLSVYSIYQFFARKYSLPLSNIYFERFMVSGYNWTNPIKFMNQVFYRSNAILREPSFYSQHAALTLLLISKSKDYSPLRKKMLLLINTVGLFFSFSGTGLLIIVLYFFLKVLFKAIKACKEIEIAKFKIIFRKCIGKILVANFIMIFVIFCIYKINIYDYISNYLVRLREILLPGSSAYARFISPWLLILENIEKIILLGYGNGYDKIIASNFNVYYQSNVISKILIELGLLGFVLWILFLLSFINKSNLKNQNYKTLFYFILIQHLNGGYFLDTTFWSFIYFINCKLIDD